MPISKEPRILVAVVGTTRAWELCWESFSSNVLDELGADLALCVGDRDHRPNPFYERAKFVWETHEPDDWAEAYDRAAGDSSWRALVRPGDLLLGGIRDTERPQPGIGALVIYMRWFLKKSLEGAGILRDYDWLVLTRSDFLWPVPHPHPRNLSRRRIYVLDGEQYGGICGRHLIVPRRLVERVLSVYDPVFTDAERLRRRLERRSEAAGWEWWNLERFQAARFKELGLLRRLTYLPYLPFTVRAPDGATGWSVGVYDGRLGFNVKYPTERERSEIARRFIRDQDSWRKHLGPIRGAAARRKLRSAYRERGLYERPFQVRERARRELAEARESVREARQRGRERAHRARVGASELRMRAEVRIGRGLRRLPGVSPLLDARIRRIQRRSPAP
jgi:hypothetical protein